MTFIVFEPDRRLPGRIRTYRLDESGMDTHVARVQLAPLSEELALQLSSTISREINAGCRHFVFDLKKVQQIHGPGMGLLVRSYMQAHEADGQLVVINASQRIRIYLELIRINRVIPVLDSMEDARRYFEESPEMHGSP